MRVEANGTWLWFDVEGPSLVPDGSGMRPRPTVVLLHGGPGSYDHSYFKPEFGRLADHAQVVYLDLRGHGRSEWGDPERWSFELCADDVRAFCEAIGITRPVVLGHSMGGFVAMLHGARHPGHAAALVLQSTLARFDLARIEEGFRRFGGDQVATLAVRDFGGDPVSDEEWARVFATFGPDVPGPERLARRVQNPAVAERGMRLFRELDVVAELAGITCPTLVCTGELDPITPVAAAREIAGALPEGAARLEILPDAGHFPWMDVPDRYWDLLGEFVTTASAGDRDA
jgi:pimeloyl-ACP methyl ester carboxylesterase